MDTLSKERRSWNMSRIRSKDTNPEKKVRSALHRMGYRFRLHSNSLPGCPDIALSKYKAVIFVHGCFWHRHPGCRFAFTPKSNQKYWIEKFHSNVERDKKHREELIKLGWQVLTIWECEVMNGNSLTEWINENILNKLEIKR